MNIDQRIAELADGDSNDAEIDGLLEIISELQEGTVRGTVTLTPMQLQSIVREIADMGPSGQVQDVRIATHVGTIALVTLDAGYGTYSFYVHVGGKVVQAGMGEHVER